MRSLAAAAVVLGLVAACVVRADAPATDVPLVVLVNDGDPNTMSRSNGIVREALGVLREQLVRDGHDVKTGEMLQASLGWDLERRLDTTELLRVAHAARESGRPEFDVRVAVIFSMVGRVLDQGFSTKLDLTIRGSLYDVASQRQLGRFGPLSRSMSAPAGCAGSCIESVGRPVANELAAIVGDEALAKLAQLALPPLPIAVPSDPARDERPDGISYDSGLTTTYTIRFEDFAQSEMLEVIEIMESEFPEFVSSRGVEGTARRGTYGYLSRASGQDLYRWLVMLLGDMGLDPDSRAQIVKQGTKFTLKKLGETS